MMMRLAVVVVGGAAVVAVAVGAAAAAAAEEAEGAARLFTMSSCLLGGMRCAIRRQPDVATCRITIPSSVPPAR